MPRVTGLSVSSTISLAGSGGQLLTPNDAAADELLEPRPARIPVVVGGDVEAEPGAAVLHVSLEGLLLRAGRTAVEPDDQLVLLQVLVVHVRPVAGGFHAKVVSVRLLRQRSCSASVAKSM